MYQNSYTFPSPTANQPQLPQPIAYAQPQQSFAPPSAFPTHAPLHSPGLVRPVQHQQPLGLQAGWHSDPWGRATWRWWDGYQWTSAVNSSTKSKPKLPNWLSWPIIAAALPTIGILGNYIIKTPLVLLLILIPLAVVYPAFHWLDRITPQSTSSRIHAIFWGATVAVSISFIVNTIFGVFAIVMFQKSGLALSAVISAPFIEEITKALGIYWAVRRKEITQLSDGILFAGWVALGFAIAEDVLYFSKSAQPGGKLMIVVFLRGVLLPFSHPLFTAWTGLAISKSIKEKKPLVSAVWGLCIAIGSHMLWNGSLALYEKKTISGSGLGLIILLFISMFTAAIVLCVKVRKREQREFEHIAPAVASSCGLLPHEVMVFSSWGMLRNVRSQTPPQLRKRFDALHHSLARLATLHTQPQSSDSEADRQREIEIVRNATQALRCGR
jgi:protease PrsW